MFSDFCSHINFNAKGVKRKRGGTAKSSPTSVANRLLVPPYKNYLKNRNKVLTSNIPYVIIKTDKGNINNNKEKGKLV